MPGMESYKSQGLRDELSDVLNKVHFGNQVVRVRRYRTDMAFIVPPEWFARACEALGVDPERPEALGGESPSA